ncbi:MULTISPECIES: Fur family transcriptional regulator [Corynebacterium]|jgi:Fur family ferric uptake transcriptional regulator|uniref:Zinc uptake regulation protein n=1 Tax=Corynebacterium provencense TaxID=1737425 RepID=A0A2Z3YQN5_9CORY|nr:MULTISPECIES: transcriptional repressor [Corynebacterium]AWT26529.1 Zinc uptake regulation protein [Corynebacterium provencense]MCI1257102.1 transcriptional repressor [Corynebacterium provencense]
MNTARDHSDDRPRIGQRTTRQRTAVVGALDGLTSFTSAQDIHAALTASGQKVGLTTVYRTLQQLTAAGMVDTLQDDSGEMLYRSCSTDHHHHHLVCTNCRKTVEIDGGPVEAWAARVAADHGFTLAGHTADVFGLCPDCAARRRAS